MRKAQASFFVLLGILLIVSVVLYFSYTNQTSPVPQGISQVHQAVSTSVAALATDCGYTMIKMMEDYGGYPIPTESDIKYLNHDVSYWQVCSIDGSPNINNVTEWMELGIEVCLQETITNVVGAYAPQGVSLGNTSTVSIDVSILDNRIDFDVAAPVSIENPEDGETYSIEETFPKVTIPTYFGRIFKFGKDFTTEYKNPPILGGRFFEVFNILSLYHSGNLPTVGVLTECGESINIPPILVSLFLTQNLNYVLDNTVMWQNFNAVGTDGRTFGIPSVNGNVYADLNPQFVLPDNFFLPVFQGITITNSKHLSDFYPFVIPECVTAYHQTYSMSYPIIVRVEDTLLEHAFNFGVFNSIVNMRPAPCAPGDLIPTTDPTVPDDLDCTGWVKVRDSDGEPIHGARVTYNGYQVGSGQTDEEGMLEGAIICAPAELIVTGYDTTYGTYRETLNLVGSIKTVTLYKRPEVTYKFREMDITVYEGDNTYSPCLYNGVSWSWRPINSYDSIKCVRDVPDETVDVRFVELGSTNPFTASTPADPTGDVGTFDAFIECDENCKIDFSSDIMAEIDCFNNNCLPLVEGVFTETEETDYVVWTVTNRRFGDISSDDTEAYDTCMDDCLGLCGAECSDECVFDCTALLPQGVTAIVENSDIAAGGYDIDSTMFTTTSSEYVINGGFESIFTLEEDASELYLIIPRFEGSITQSQHKWNSDVRQCLADTLELCETAPITDVEPTHTTVKTSSDCGVLLEVLNTVLVDKLDQDERNIIEENKFCYRDGEYTGGFPCGNDCTSGDEDCNLYCDVSGFETNVESIDSSIDIILEGG
jgi:hypothetical protein